MATIKVSPFELLIKPIAPTKTTNPALNSVNRVIIQGYFLTLSNLEDKPREFVISFVISAPQPPFDKSNVSRILENKTILVYDIAGENTSLQFDRKTTQNTQYIRYESDSFVLPNFATMSIQLLPDANLVATQSETQLEVRGFCELTANNGVTGEIFLNPEIRGTFIPNEFLSISPASVDEKKSFDFDQLSYSLGVQKQTL